MPRYTSASSTSRKDTAILPSLLARRCSIIFGNTPTRRHASSTWSRMSCRSRTVLLTTTVRRPMGDHSWDGSMGRFLLGVKEAAAQEHELGHVAGGAEVELGVEAVERVLDLRVGFVGRERIVVVVV